jgi:hypothetical protein
MVESSDRASALKWLDKTLSPETFVLLDIENQKSARLPFHICLLRRPGDVETLISRLVGEGVHQIITEYKVFQRQPPSYMYGREGTTDLEGANFDRSRTLGCVMLRSTGKAGRIPCRKSNGKMIKREATMVKWSVVT